MNDMHRRHVTVQDWVREYRQLRRRDLLSEEAFHKRQRVLFRVSSYVKWRGWTGNELEEALAVVATEPVPELLKTKQKAVRTTKPARHRGMGNPGRGVGRDKESLTALETAPILGIRKPKVIRVHCKDCGKLLPPGRRCGCCDWCKRIKACESKRKWWHKRKHA